MATTTPCRHQPRRGAGRRCPDCRREGVIDHVTAAGVKLPRRVVADAVDAVVADRPATLRSLAAALTAHPTALTVGAPPTVGRLVVELIARGGALGVPTCAVCGRTDRPLNVTDTGGMCPRCAARRDPQPCARCAVTKPVAGYTSDRQPICERCRRHERGHRRCGVCGNSASIAVRARDGKPDVCVNCYRPPQSVCSRCGRTRPCLRADTPQPMCKPCSPRATDICARCGLDRPPSVRWPEGPLCDTCYTTALRRRAHCARCGSLRRLVAPPGPAATICADCAGLPASHTCADCGVEDKLYERGRCAACSLRRRAEVLLRGEGEQVPAQLAGVYTAIVTTSAPRSALNWLRNGAGAAVLAEVAAGRLALTHEALDTHPRPQAADLRHVLVANGALPPRDEGVARTERWATELVATVRQPQDRRLLKAYTTWRVLRRLRRSAAQRPRPRTYTAAAHVRLRAAVDFLTWLADRNLTLTDCQQPDVDRWLGTGPPAGNVRDFLLWAAEHKHCRALHVPPPPRNNGTATEPEQRWAQVTRLLHDETIDLTDRVAGCLLLLYGQQLSRIAAMTTDQVTNRDGTVVIRFGRDEINLPDKLGRAVLELTRSGRPYTGVGSPASRWLFPGLLPGKPITASRLGERLRGLGISALPGRRSTMIHLAGHLPAAVLADLLNLAPTTAVRWMHQAGADWTRYAAALAQDRDPEP